MEKYYYSIGEVCNLLNIKPHTIRYWETEFPQVRPKRTSGDTRRYTKEKIEMLRMVRDLLYVQQFTVKGVKKKLSNFRSSQKTFKATDHGIINQDLKESLIKQLSNIKDELEQIRAKSLTNNIDLKT